MCRIYKWAGSCWRGERGEERPRRLRAHHHRQGSLTKAGTGPLNHQPQCYLTGLDCKQSFEHAPRAGNSFSLGG